MVKTGPGSSPGGHRQPRVRGQGPVPTGPGSGRWETHQAGHLGSERLPRRERGKGAGLLPGGPFCARAHLHGRELSAAGLASAALIPLLPTCSPEIRTQLQTQIKESLPHKSGRPAVGTRPGLHLPDLGEGRGETQAGTDLEIEKKGARRGQGDCREFGVAVG